MGTQGDAGTGPLDVEERHPRRPARGDDQIVGEIRVGDEELRAVERAADLPAQSDRAGLELAAVFEHGERADPAPQRHVGDGALVGGRSRAEQEGRGDHRARDVRAGEAGAPHLLGQEHDVEDGPVAAAEVAGDEQSRPAELAELRPQRAAVLVQRLASGRRLERAVAGEEVAGRALQEPLAVGRAEVHRSAPAVSARSAGRGPASPRWCAGSRRCRRRWCGRGSSSRRAG